MNIGFEPARMRIKPASGQIYDITHADVDEHSVDLPTGCPANTKAILIYAKRITGTGSLYLYSVSGVGSTNRWILSSTDNGVWIRALDGKFYYALSVANDDWDIYCIGYIIGG